MKKTVMTVMALFFVAAVSTPALASHWGKGPSCDGAQGHGRYNMESFRGMNQLNLTADQTAKLAELKNARTKELMPLQEQMFAKRNVIKALWLEPNPSQEKIIAAQKELLTLRGQMEEKVTSYRLESLKVLTPAQQEIVKALFSSKRPGAQGGMRAPARGGFENSARGNCGASTRGGGGYQARGGAAQFGFGPGSLR